jgi:hypothetical protein
VIDGGVVAGYLAVLLGGAAKRFVDGRIDGGLTALYDRVVRRLGGAVVRDLRQNPDDVDAQHRVARAVENIAAVDRRFAGELAAIVDRLDRAGGRQFVNQVQAHTNIQAWGDQAVHGGVINKSWSRSAEHPSNYSGAPAWVKVITALGAVLLFGGLGLLAVEIVTTLSAARNEIGRFRLPDLTDLKQGAILFACGLLLSLVGGLGRSMSRRGW